MRKNWKSALALTAAAAMAVSGQMVYAGEENQELEYVKLKAINVGDGDVEHEKIYLEKINELLLRDLNCELEMEDISWSDWKTKYSLSFASGEDFDFIFTANWCFYNDQAVKGGFYELTEDDFKNYMPNTYEAVGDKLYQTKINGKMYMIPESSPNMGEWFFFGARGDLMAEAGIEEITTTQEMEQYLDYVVANHPELNVINMTGSTAVALNKMLKFFAADDEEVSKYLIGDNGYYLIPSYETCLVDCTDLTDLKLVDEEIIDSLNIKLFTKAKEMLEKGYWSEDCLSQNTLVEEYYQAGNGATMFRQLDAIFGANKSIEKIDPDMDPHIIRLTDDSISAAMAPCTNNGIGIHATTKYPERVMMVLDKLGYDPEYYDLARYGVEGENYTLTEEGTVIPNPDNLWTSLPIAMGFNTTLYRENAEEKTAVNKEFDEMKEWYCNNGYTPVLSAFIFDNSAVTNEIAAVSSIRETYLPILDAGLAEDVEATYNEYKEALKSAGIEKIMEEYLRQAQAFCDSLQ